MSVIAINTTLITDIKKLIDGARQRVAQTFNAELTLLYWQIGHRLHSEILKGERAEYGKQVIKDLSNKLTTLYGRGWSEKQFWHCLRFVETFPVLEIVSAARRQLSWTHFKTLIYIENPLKRDFYLQFCQIENWTSRELRDRINSMFYERTALSKQPDALISQELETMSKTGVLAPDLRWLAKYETEKDENPPLGIILCAGKKHEQIELLELSKSGIHVAEYLTVLPPREVLQAKLQHSVEQARHSIESKEEASA